MRVINLASGSRGNATLIEDESASILIDDGLYIRELEDRLFRANADVKKLSAILITHSHNDHILGVVALSNKYNLPVYASALIWQEGKLKGVIEPNRKLLPEMDWYLGNFTISSFNVSHDAVDTRGFSFISFGKKVSIVTDLGKYGQDLIDKLSNSHLVLIESNHDKNMLVSGKYPYTLKRRILSDFGHLSNDDASSLIVELAKIGTKHFMLMHLSKENNTPEIAFNTCNQYLLQNFGDNHCIKIYLSSQDKVSKNFILK